MSLSDEVTIRAATPADRPAIWAMIGPVFRAGDTYAVDRDISRDDALAMWMAEHAFVLCDGAAPLGTYYIKRNQKGGGDHVCNCGFVTAREAEGHGVARAMLVDALARAPTLGFEAMQFNFVLANNARAVDIWRRAGFTQVGCIPRAFRHPADGYVDALILWKDLTDA